MTSKPSASPGKTPAAQQDPSVQKKELAKEIGAIARDLGKGMSGKDVLVLQKALVSLGYLKTIPNEVFGQEVEDAIVRFKIDKKLATDRNDERAKRFGAGTRNKMREVLDAPQAVTASVRTAVAGVAQQRNAPAPAPKSLESETARLVTPPPEWKERNPAAYRFYQKIAGEVASGNPFPRSKNSQTSVSYLLHGDNDDRWRQDYLQVYPAYDELEHKFKPERCDIKPGAYWKADLNIEPGDVITVSLYLRDKGYRHDYLQGSPEQTFSVYFGSKDMADHGIKRLERDLGKYLKKPRFADGKYTLGQELGTNISGEFRVHRSAAPLKGYKEADIPGYGFAGIPVVGPYTERNCKPGFFQKPDKEQKFLALRDVRTGFRKMTELFGTYFHGTNK